MAVLDKFLRVVYRDEEKLQEEKAPQNVQEKVQLQMD
jgi:hypothetical protein